MGKKKKLKQKRHQQTKQRKRLRQRRRKKARKSSEPTHDFADHRTGARISKQLLNSHQHPIHECWINDNWQEQGIAQIIVSRKLPLVGYVSGVYLVDTKCLGLKNTFLSLQLTAAEYDKFITQIAKRSQAFNLIECAYNLANAIIHGGILYAEKIGFQPHHEFADTKHVLGPAIESEIHVPFGDEDGKPHYISGPDDDWEAILEKLKQTVGDGNFHFTVMNLPNDF